MLDKSQRPPLANNIAGRRKALGLSQSELADAIGFHVNTIKDIERGLSEGHPDTRQALASFFKCTVGELYDGDAGRGPSVIRDGAPESPKLRLIARILTMDDREVLGILDALDPAPVALDSEESAKPARRR